MGSEGRVEALHLPIKFFRISFSVMHAFPTQVSVGSYW